MTRRAQPRPTAALADRAPAVGRSGDTWWTHIPNGGRRSPIEAAIFKSLGVRAGSPDLLIIRAGQPMFLELKAPAASSPPHRPSVTLRCGARAQIETADNTTRRSHLRRARGAAMTERSTFILQLRAERGVVDPIRNMRALLKTALRRFGARN